MHKTVAVGGLSTLIGLCAVSAALAAYLLLTPFGSELLTRMVLRWALKTDAVTIEQLEGTLARGMVLDELQIANVAGMRTDSPLMIDDVTIAPFVAAGQGMDVTMRDIQLGPTPFARELVIASAQGRVSESVTFSDVVIRDPARLPPGSTIEIQRLDLGFPLHWDRVQVVHNGRIRLPYSEPIAVFATRQQDQLLVQAYSKGLDVREWVSLVTTHPRWRRLTGAITDVELSASGSLDALMVSGHFQVEQLRRQEFMLLHAPGIINLTLRGLPESPSVTGAIALWSGTVRARQTTITLQRGRFVFDGDPLRPQFDIRGTSTIGGIKITIVLTGTKDQPELRLTSDPPRAQGVLLLMLATGKRWKGVQETLAQGVISTDLAVDFLDYFIFGGLGSRLAKRLGITDLALTHDPQTRRVGVETTLGDKVELGVEVDPSTTTDASQTTEDGQPYGKVGAAYQLTPNTSIGVEGERSAAPSSASSHTGDAGEDGSASDADETILFKLKKRF